MSPRAPARTGGAAGKDASSAPQGAGGEEAPQGHTRRVLNASADVQDKAEAGSGDFEIVSGGWRLRRVILGCSEDCKPQGMGFRKPMRRTSSHSTLFMVATASLVFCRASRIGEASAASDGLGDLPRREGRLHLVSVCATVLQRPQRSLVRPCQAQQTYQSLLFPTDTGAKPSDIENKVTVSAFARRRLAVVMVRLKMAETVSDVSHPGLSCQVCVLMRMFRR